METLNHLYFQSQPKPGETQTPKSPKKEPAQSNLGQRPNAPKLPKPDEKPRYVYGQD